MGVHQEIKVADAEEMVSAEIQKQTCGRTRQVSQPSPFKQAKEKGKGMLGCG